MDTPSHALFGLIIALLFPDIGLAAQIMIVAGAVAPDLLGVAPAHFVLARKLKKPLRKIDRADWRWSQEHMPGWTDWYFFTHGLGFAFLLVVPFAVEWYLTGAWLNLSWFAFVGWMSHIFYDLTTHLEEWRLKPFYPLSGWRSIWEWTNAWEWPYWKMAISWAIHLAAIGLIAWYQFG